MLSNGMVKMIEEDKHHQEYIFADYLLMEKA
jgi:hypothetical protein